jgi:hydrogenase maturation protease
LKGNEKNFLIVGVGNIYRGDDGAGILVARYLRRCFGDKVKIVGYDISFEELLDLFGEVDFMILVDAVVSEGKVGDVHRIEVGDKFDYQGEFYSTHSLGVGDYIKIARSLGKSPKKLIIYGIVGGNFEIGVSLSSEVKSACKKVVNLILSEIGLIKE